MGQLDVPLVVILAKYHRPTLCRSHSIDNPSAYPIQSQAVHNALVAPILRCRVRPFEFLSPITTIMLSLDFESQCYQKCLIPHVSINQGMPH